MSNLFFEDTSILSDIKIVKMMSDYGFAGFGYYCAIIAELYKNGGKYEFEDLQILAKNTGIEKKKLKKFINCCISKYINDNKGIFNADNDIFWSDKIICVLTKQGNAKKNRAGRKKCEEPKPIVTVVPDIEYVRLTDNDIEKLISRFGKEVILKGIQILDNWLHQLLKCRAIRFSSYLLLYKPY